MFTVNKLKISGFKSFANPVELLVEDGVTGIIGPNGCGKSNIFEAIRWVMGESSSKSLRSGAMDDVIFNGTQNLPAKNYVEVSMELENFSGEIQNLKFDEKKLIITRILERGVGSFFKINNKDVRAKDVSVLFYDSGSGPRSSSIITQGNIDQIIDYKPIERKIILEDAAGTSGLQARRRESELKLQSTDINLEKVEINLNNLLDQKKSLSRQARQAERYESLSQTIKFYESLLILSEWKDIKNNIEKSSETVVQLRESLKLFIENSSENKRKVLILKNEINSLQEKKNKTSQELFNTENQKNALLNKLELIKNKKNEIRKFLNTIVNDKNNEYKILSTLENYIKEGNKKISKEAQKPKLLEKLKFLTTEEVQLRNEVKQLEGFYVNEMQLTLGDEFKSDNLKEEKDNLKKEKNQNSKVLKELTIILKKYEKSKSQDDSFFEELNSEKKNCELQIKEIKNSIHLHTKKINSNKDALRKIEIDTEVNLKNFTEIKTEIKTLKQLIGDAKLSKDSIVNLIKIKSGYENAVYAALTHELDATLNKSPKKWVKQKNIKLERLQNPLSKYVTGPSELDLILSQIGVLHKNQNPQEEQKKLKVGQLLVDTHGNMWRWDGFISHDNLQKKKIIDSELKINRLESENKSLEKKLDLLTRNSSVLKQSTESLENTVINENKKLEFIYKNFDLVISKLSKQKEKITITNYNIQKNIEQIKDLEKKIVSILSRLKEIDSTENLLNQNFDNKSKSDFEKKIRNLDEKIEFKRKEIISVKELIMKEDLDKTYLVNDIKKSEISLKDSKKKIELYDQRQKTYLIEEKKLESLPNEIEKKINNLQGISNSLNNDLTKNNDSLNQLSLELKNVEENLLKVEQKRENQRNEITKFDSLLENLKTKENELRSLIFQRSNKQPEEIEVNHKVNDQKFDSYEKIKEYLKKLSFQREQMGPVNLRAKIEEKEIQTMIEDLQLEKNDLVDALQKLREAINKINHEGKNRLLVAFEKVNKNFSDLFVKLFNGGEAKLELVKSDDPLQTGLEIYARPPGKKLSNINLLSGGEKTLTAISLIFSIFLINPSPICILDEVDAALDDVNVEKFCVILNELKTNTKTKFLIITHNKITMTSIDRVYGVTMAQKGISDIVSVDFEKIDFQEAI